MKDIKKIIETHAGPPSNWREKVKYRKDNEWLGYSAEIARRILAAIEDNKDMTQAKLAAILGVSPQHISKIVKGTENLTLETIHKLSQALQIELITFPDYKYSKIIDGNTKPRKSKKTTTK